MDDAMIEAAPEPCIPWYKDNCTSRPLLSWKGGAEEPACIFLGGREDCVISS